MQAQLTDRPVAGPDRRDRNLSIRASADYLDWLDRLAVASRAPVSVLVDQAIARYAAGIHFEPPPPKR